MSTSSIEINDNNFEFSTGLSNFKKFYRFFKSVLLTIGMIRKRLDIDNKNDVYTFFDEYDREDRRRLEYQLRSFLALAIKYYKTTDTGYQQHLKRKREGRYLLI